MASKPSILTRLTHGKLIDTFRGFVDTWNYIVDFVENICGEGDLDSSKSITIDRSVPDHPVICGGGGDGTPPDDASITTHDKKLKIFGFYDAPNQTVACKRNGVITFVDESEIGGGGSVSVTGTDGVTVTGNAIVLQSESDSNVTAKATVSGGVITLKIGVYWV